MNNDTRIAVSCYAGDQQQVEQMLGFYLHHECPLVIFSPTNSKAEIKHPGVENRFAGGRAQYGPIAHARHLEFLKILLTYPENHFLMHESDSLCLDPKIPNYLYEEPDTVWSNAGNAMDYNAAKFPAGCPPLSFQAPWFLSRKTIEAFVAAADKVPGPADDDRGSIEWWVDLYLVQLTYAAQLTHKSFPDGYLGPVGGRYDAVTNTFFDPMPERDEATGYFFDPKAKRKPYSAYLAGAYADNFEKALTYVRDGARMIHSVKNPIAAMALWAEYKKARGDTQ